MAKNFPVLTCTEIAWIVQALNHEIVTYRDEIKETDSDVIKNLSYLAIETRTNLVTKLTDIACGTKNILKLFKEKMYGKRTDD